MATAVQCVCEQFKTLPDNQHLCAIVKLVDPDLKDGGCRDMILEWLRTSPGVLLDLYNCCKNWGTVIACCNRNMWAIDTLVNVFNVSVSDIINVSKVIHMNVIVHLMGSMSFEDACVLMQPQ